MVDEADEDSNAAGVNKSGSVFGDEGSESESVEEEHVLDSSPDAPDEELPAADECEDKNDFVLSFELLGSFFFPLLLKLRLDERM